MDTSFYWRHARDSLLTKSALRMFQLLSLHEGEVFDDVKQSIDDDYFTAVGSDGTDRHGGQIQSQLQSFREGGWATLNTSKDPKGIIEITPAGKQALLLLDKLPSFLKAAPFFLVTMK